MSRISRDGGNTWADERTAYTGDNVFSNGVWEPSAIQLPSGDIQLFFANESPYRSSDAPYLVQMPTGESVLSVQSTEGRAQNSLSDANMQVYVGDGTAQNFANRSTPFLDLPAGASALWNSMTVLELVNGNLRDPNSGKCLDANAGGTTNGTQLIIWDCGNAQSNQTWSFQV